MLQVTKSGGRSFWAAVKQMRIGKEIHEIVGVGGWVSNRTISSKATMSINVVQGTREAAGRKGRIEEHKAEVAATSDVVRTAVLCGLSKT